ncbi:N-acetylmuramic acid 6-phosphate etherase [Oceanobacillus profundus]|uniref:N-acetylmuramic acid 6-phosphate etherase n=1 Tax=Oceanobacillus profundus TaxID=372463 RepID=A0A417YP25_9BACI|nr:N-acetylmuramic acid 6-phosphate etherase [Oceanobacillus profundus]MBR3117943.1 N-acetylmuramic acid 6-phosphate etherase [Oceanobacillus sp.]MDO6451245.1 N-acetylmuramic acid 6-phosphate etherase [Oceanobacillus profundus]RHW35535.1 N-acetylmuramic acid 6-phosphate etherase [Oceanobacillus profundus]
MLEKLTTEARNQHTMHLDEMTTLDILRTMNKEDQQVLTAIKEQLPQIEKATKYAIESFNKNGRLIYVGAGTSGRLGVLDAVECVPTFGTSPEMVQGIIAGGMKALYEAAEGAEDDPELGANDLKSIQLSENDTVIGIAASGRTPYVIGALQYANSKKASTVSISCNKDAVMSQYASVAIELLTGSEVLTGSTRLKAGTSQKMVLNMISTASMVGIGKVYQNFMVDLKPTNEKLEERSKRNIMEVTGVDYETAASYFEKSKHQVKIAIVMILLQCSYEDAINKLKNSDGFVRRALAK